VPENLSARRILLRSNRLLHRWAASQWSDMSHSGTQLSYCIRIRLNIGCSEANYPNALLLFRSDPNSHQQWPWEIHGFRDNLGFARV
jgi:hypothetical protein